MTSIDIQEKRYAGELILQDISLHIAPGERVGILGPSGIGKTTLLRIANGLDKEFSGEVTRPATQAAIFQQPTLLPWRSAYDNIALFCPQLSEAEITSQFSTVDLSGKEASFPEQLSLGQQRRLALIRGFANRPEFLTMDEPFTSLDQALVTEMLALSKTLLDSFRPSLLFVTHAQAEAEYLVDSLYRLEGRPAQLVSMN